MSYGVPEGYQCLAFVGRCTNTTLYVQRTNTEFAKIAARGITLVASSGDNGAPGDENDDCTGTHVLLFPLLLRFSFFSFSSFAFFFFFLDRRI
jgi:hypothetical protein